MIPSIQSTQVNPPDFQLSRHLYMDSGQLRPRSFNCNACVASLPVTPALSVLDPIQTLQVHPGLVTAELTGENWVVYSPLSSVGAVVLSAALHSILDVFALPVTLDAARIRLLNFSQSELERIVLIMVNCGILYQPAFDLTQE